MQEMGFPIYVISLPTATNRREYITKQLQLLNLNFMFFDAIKGVDIYETHEYSDKLAHKNENRALTKGEVGCAASHRNLYRKIATEIAPYALILEDDALINDDLPQFLEYIKPFLTGSTIITLERCDCYWKKTKQIIYKNYSIVTPYFVKEGAIAQTAGYIITKQAANAIKDINVPIAFPADSWGHYKKYVTFKGVIPSQTLIRQNINLESQTQSNGKIHSEKKHNAFDFILWAILTETLPGKLFTNIYKKFRGNI